MARASLKLMMMAIPYWITGAGTATIGMRGAPMITTIVITNAITGESEEYPINEVPDWSRSCVWCRLYDDQNKLALPLSGRLVESF